MSIAPTADSFFATEQVGEEEIDGAPRNWQGAPLIVPVPGDEHLALKRPKNPNHKGLMVYDRASGFGSNIEDDFHLVKWQKRQVARGMALMYERVKLSVGPGGGLDANPAVEPGPDDQGLKAYWDSMAERAENEVGSYDKAKLGTAIHSATEAVDRGEDLSGWPELLRERADAYYRFTRELGIRPSSIETFGVEDTYRVAGTWDRTGWWRGRHFIFDVKTSGTMKYAGIGFAVQLAAYSRMCAYDYRDGSRTPHEAMDLDVGWIIHVGREQGSPVELYRVDIATGWRFAGLVATVKEARNIGTRLITELEPTETARAIYRADTVDSLSALWSTLTKQQQRDHALDFKEMAAWLRNGGAR